MMTQQFRDDINETMDLVFQSVSNRSSTMTDTAPKEPTKAEVTAAEKAAAAYAKDRTKEPGYSYRLVPNGKGGSKWTAKKIEKAS